MNCAISGNITNKIGGYSWLIKFNINDSIVSDTQRKHSFLNNLELTALHDLLSYLIDKNYTTQDIKIYTTNEYIYNTISKNWLDGWAINNWKKVNGQVIKSKDLWSSIWLQLNMFIKKPLIEFTKYESNPLIKIAFKNAVEIQL